MPYIICVEKDSDGNLSGNQKGLAERAHHPEEINAASSLAIDAEYYLTQQVTAPYCSATVAALTIHHVPCSATPFSVCTLPCFSFRPYLGLQIALYCSL